jgi:hypothetical protein
MRPFAVHAAGASAKPGDPYLAAGFWATVRPRVSVLAIATALGCLAAMVKVTTVLPFMLAVGAFAIVRRALVAVLAASGIVGHQREYLALQRSNVDDMMPLARTLRATTRPQDVNVYVGFDWNPTVPYYSERRALMIPESDREFLTEADIRRALDSLQNESVGSVVVSTQGRRSVPEVETLLAATHVRFARIIVTD